MNSNSGVEPLPVVVAIHQPNFFPWLGYFEKIARSTVFVFLDHVQFQKTGGNWSNRVKMLANGEPKWVTAPVDRSFHGVRPIREVEFQGEIAWRENILGFLTRNYSKAAHFKEVFKSLEPLVLNPEKNIARYNANAVISISKNLGVGVDRFRWSSEMPVNGHANEMLISLVRAVEGSAYMCGGGAAGYQDDNLFADSGVKLRYQNFSHPIYPQIPDRPFVAGLSVIDALMHCGMEGVATMLQSKAPKV